MGLDEGVMEWKVDSAGSGAVIGEEDSGRDDSGDKEVLVEDGEAEVLGMSWGRYRRRRGSRLT